MHKSPHFSKVTTHVNYDLMTLENTLCLSPLPSGLISEHEQICRQKLRMPYKMSVICKHLESPPFRPPLDQKKQRLWGRERAPPSRGIAFLFTTHAHVFTRSLARRLACTSITPDTPPRVIFIDQKEGPTLANLPLHMLSLNYGKRYQQTY